MAKKKGMATTQISVEYQTLYSGIRQRIAEARLSVIKHVNQTLTVTYWQIGKQIQFQVLDNNRAEYGKQTVQKLSQQLSNEFGKGFSYSALSRMVKFYQAFSDKNIIATLSQQLSWSVRTLRERMDGMLFERSAIAKQPEKVIRQELAKLEQSETSSIFSLPRGNIYPNRAIGGWG
ncbi:MAG: DUF1016 N-terminal domain-containing protein [Gammaproteobacteria bacterium]|nr:DUF1016 N-terminal domain-containing protein [Gammaproteobacteria bacterium]